MGEEGLASEGADKQEDKTGEEGEVPEARVPHLGVGAAVGSGEEGEVWGGSQSQEGGGRGRRGLLTYVGCTGERKTGETRKVRGDPGGKARGKRAYLVHVGIAAGGRVTGIYLGRGVGARDSMQDRAGLTLPLPPRRPSMTLCPSMDKAVKMEGVGGG